MQIQANLGEGHVNIINAFEAVLTETHLALVMEYAACGSLTSYVANRWQVAQHTGLFLSEDEARFFMRVSVILRLNPTLLYALRCSRGLLCHERYFKLAGLIFVLIASCCSTSWSVSPVVCCMSLDTKSLNSILILVVVCAAIHTCCRLLPQAQRSAQVPPLLSSPVTSSDLYVHLSSKVQQIAGLIA